MPDSKQPNDEISQLLKGVDQSLETTYKNTSQLLDPLRRSAFRRFPTLFILLTTFGVATTFYAFERLIAKWTYVFDRPWLILLIGVAALVLTGKLYKKLG